MKKFKFYSLLTALLIMTGCSERELTFDRTYPDTAKLDEFREKRKFEIEEEIRVLPKLIMETNAMPRNIEISAEYPKDGMSSLSASQYCWDFNYLDCERIIPIHPYDIRNYDLVRYEIRANRLMKVSAALFPLNFPNPVRIEAYIYDSNKNLNLFQAVDIDTTTNTFNFTAPTEPSVYTFLFKAIYQWDIDGISYHPIQVNVR